MVELFGSVPQDVINTAETDIKKMLAAVVIASGSSIKIAGIDLICSTKLCDLLGSMWQGSFIQKFHSFCTTACLPLVGGIVSLVGGVILIIKGAHDAYSIVHTQSMFRGVKERINREIGPLLNKMHYLLSQLLDEPNHTRCQKLQFVLFQACKEYEALMTEIEKVLKAIQIGVSNSKWCVAATVLGIVSGMASIAVSLFFFLGPFSIVPAILYATGGALTLGGSFLAAGTLIARKVMRSSIDLALKNVQPTLLRDLKGILSHENIQFGKYLNQVAELAKKFGCTINHDLLSEIIEEEIKNVDRTRYCLDCPAQAVFFGAEYENIPSFCGFCGRPYTQSETNARKSIENQSLCLLQLPVELISKEVK